MAVRHTIGQPGEPDISPPRRFEWETRATCTQVDPDLWFPDGTSGAASYRAKKARVMCRWCPVAKECLDHALSLEVYPEGMWAGLNARELRQVGAMIGLGAA